jgi:hypothetical protein
MEDETISTKFVELKIVSQPPADPAPANTIFSSSILNASNQTSQIFSAGTQPTHPFLFTPHPAQSLAAFQSSPQSIVSQPSTSLLESTVYSVSSAPFFKVNSA